MINKNYNEEVVGLKSYKKIKSDHDYHPTGLRFDAGYILEILQEV